MKLCKAFMLAAFTLLLAACSDNDKPQSGNFGEIQVPDVSQLLQMAEAGEGTSQVTFTTQTAWSSSIRATRADAPDWISISPDHGEGAGTYTVQITLQPNTGTESRTAFITICCGASQIEISVTQKASTGDDDDDSQSRQPNGRPVRITEYEDGHPESVLLLTYDEEGRPAAIKSYGDTELKEAYVTWEFTYESSTKLLITEKYYDKLPMIYGRNWVCSGGGFQTAYNGASIDIADITAIEDPKSTWTYAFEYNESELSNRYEDFYYDGALSSQNEAHYVYQGSESLQIRWTNGNTQTITCDPDLSRHASAHERLFTGFRAFNPGLCFTYDSDMLLCMGFLGMTSDLLPVKVVSAWPNGNPVTETLSYKYYELDGWKSGEEIDGMEITLRNNEGSEYRYVLTFEGI